jgi:hypothetical protein
MIQFSPAKPSTKTKHEAHQKTHSESRLTFSQREKIQQKEQQQKDPPFP